MPKSIEELREAYDSVPIPEELDMVIEKHIRKARQVKRRGRVLKPLAAAAAIILVFVITVNVSPAFARYVSQVPGMESLINLIRFDRGLVDVVNHGYGQIINKSATDNGITLTVESVIFDGRKLIIAYELESDRQLARPWLSRVRLKDSQGNHLGVSTSIFPPQGENSTVFTGLLSFGHTGFTFPEDIILECTEIEHDYDTAQGSLREIISGNWTIPLRLDMELAKCEPRQLVVNKEVFVGSVKFTVENLRIYPTVIELDVKHHRNNPVRITSFKNPRLIDDDGNSFTSKSSSLGENRTTLYFESNYFINPAQLTLAIDGVYTLPWEETSFILDIKDQLVLDDGGLGVEVLWTGPYSISSGERDEYSVWFKVNDREYQTADKRFLWIDHRVHDLSGNPYDIIYCWGTDSLGEEQCGIVFFDAANGIPDTVKVTVTGISKGIMEPVQVKLK